MTTLPMPPGQTDTGDVVSAGMALEYLSIECRRQQAENEGWLAMMRTGDGCDLCGDDHKCGWHR